MGAPANFRHLFAGDRRSPLQLARSAECYCGTVEAFPPELGLPAGWRELAGGAAQCPDCAAAELPRLIPAEGARPGHHGLRIYSTAVGPDSVILRIHAGANPAPGAELIDKPLQTLARAADLDELIEHLGEIRASLKPRDKS